MFTSEMKHWADYRLHQHLLAHLLFVSKIDPARKCLFQSTVSCTKSTAEYSVVAGNQAEVQSVQAKHAETITILHQAYTVQIGKPKWCHNTFFQKPVNFGLRLLFLNFQAH